MGLSACNSAGHLSNHADVAPHFAGTTFAISNTLVCFQQSKCLHFCVLYLLLYSPSNCFFFVIDYVLLFSVIDLSYCYFSHFQILVSFY